MEQSFINENEMQFISILEIKERIEQTRISVLEFLKKQDYPADKENIKYSEIKNVNLSDWDLKIYIIVKCADFNCKQGRFSPFGEIKNAKFGFSEEEFFNLDFSFMKLDNVAFSFLDPRKKDRKKFFNLKFIYSYLHNVSFAQSDIEKCVFDKALLYKVDFLYSNLFFTRFKGAVCAYIDFRYSLLKNCTLGDGLFFQNDFYMTSFEGVISFDNAKFKLCSFTNTLFESSVVKSENLVDEKTKIEYSILNNYDAELKDIIYGSDAYGFIQSSYKEYLTYIDFEQWNRYNPSGQISIYTSSGETDLYKECENNFRYFSGLYSGKGLFKESNEAYRKAKEYEKRYYYAIAKNSTKLSEKISSLFKALVISILGTFFGYGYKIKNVIILYCLIVVVYAVLYNIRQDNCDILDSIGYSMSNTIGSNSVFNGFFHSIIAAIQSTAGMLITGVAGFILANKIRNN